MFAVCAVIKLVLFVKSCHYCNLVRTITMINTSSCDFTGRMTEDTGGSRHFERGGGERQCIGHVVIYYKCTQ